MAVQASVHDIPAQPLKDAPPLVSAWHRVRFHAVALGCFVVVALVVVGPALLGWVALGPESALDRDALYRIGRLKPVPPTSDLTPIFIDLPRDLAVARGLWAGRLDTWAPLVGFGAPLWAEQGGPFFPAKLPFYLFPSPRGYVLFLGLRLIAAAFGAYLLARERGLAPGLALMAGVFFELSGALAAHVGFGAASPVYMLPWVVLGAERIIRHGTITVAALALGCTGLGGHPTEILMVFLAFAAALAGHLVAARPRLDAIGAIAGRGAVAGALGVALAAPSLLPLADLTSRATFYRLEGAGGAYWYLFLEQSRRMLPVGLFAPGTLAPFRDGLPSVFPWALGPTIGLTGLVAALIGVFRRALDGPLVAVGVLGVGLTLAPPGFGWLHGIPGIQLILPRYAWVLVALPLTQAAAGGLAALKAGDRRCLLLALATLLIGCTSLTLIQDGSIFRYRSVLERILATTDGRLRLLVPLAVPFAAAAMAIVLPRRTVAIFATATVLEALLFVVPLCWLPPSEVLRHRPSPAVRFLQRRLGDGTWRMLGVPPTIGQPFTPALFGLADVRGFFALPLQRYSAYVDLMPDSGLGVEQHIKRARSPLLDLGAVRYLVLQRPRTPGTHMDGDPMVPLVYSDRYVAIYESLAALPRARLVHRADRLPDAEAAAAWLAERTADAAGGDLGALATTVAVEPAADGSECPPLGVATEADAVSLAPTGDPDRVVVRVRTASPALAVIADTYDPDWQAQVDGRPAAIFPVNLLFRGVFVPPGEHDIVLTHAPRSVRDGMVLALLALVSLVGGVVGRRMRRAPGASARRPETQRVPHDRWA